MHLKLLFSVSCQTTITFRAILAYISITCGSATQCITLFPLICGSTTLWEVWVHHIYNFLFRWVHHLLTVPYRAIGSLHFPHLWVHHTVNYIILYHMWVCHTVRIMGLPHLGFPFLVGPPPSSLCISMAFRSTRIFSIVGVDILVNHSLQSYQSPDNFKSWLSCSY